jgi:asparagine synthase (glutamine-hydrolysing)
MCGIFGHFAPDGTADPERVRRMAVLLAHRGPDGFDVHHDPAQPIVSIGAGRLAIIDLSAPPGALYSEDRRVVVVFNGEIYNHRALRAELERAGHTFATRTDTEVIVHGYEEWGTGVLARLEGMFAIGIWDAAREVLLLARDRMGEKPLYYAPLPDGGLVFASEIKALFAHPDVPRAVNRAVLPEVLVLGITAPPDTLFAGIHKLAPAEWMRVSAHERTIARFWEPRYDTADAPPYPEAVRLLRSTLERAVERQMMSDVPIGAFLSGGVDSSAVVGMMRAHSPYAVQTFTVGFDFPAGSEADRKFNVDVRYAAEVAHAFGTSHHVITLKQDRQITHMLPALIYALDEPIVMPTIVQTVYVAGLARAHGVKVLLSGEGSDESFFGYTHYRAEQTLSRYMALPALLRRGLLDPLLARIPFEALQTLARKAGRTTPEARYLEWLRRVDHDRAAELLVGGSVNASENALARILRPWLNAPGARDSVQQVAWADARLVLAENMNMRVDKMCMAVSVEARAPFQDTAVVDLAYRLPTSYKLGGDFKRVLKDALRGLVPEAALTRPKWGFNPPASGWLRGLLRPLVESMLSRDQVERAGLFEWRAVERVVQAHLHEGRYEMWSVWALLSVQLWHALYIDQSLSPESFAGWREVFGAGIGQIAHSQA